jgi:hypothetical protein
MRHVGLFRRILVAASLVLLGAPCSHGQKLKPGQAFVRGNVLLEGSPLRGAEMWIWNINQSSGKLQIYLEFKADKNGTYGTQLPQGRYLVSAQLPKKMDKQRSRTIYRFVTLDDRAIVTQDFDFSIKWREAENLKQAFLASLSQVLASAREERPMKSILWTPFGEDSSIGSIWIPSVFLPGADNCSIYSLSSMQINGQGVSLPTFSCDTLYANRDTAESGYHSLVGFVAQATGWTASTRSSTQTTSFQIADLPAYDEVLVRLTSKENRVTLSYETTMRSPEWRQQLGSLVQPNAPRSKMEKALDTASGSPFPEMRSRSGPTESFASALRRIKAASQEDPPFLSLRVQGQSGSVEAASLLSIPGFDSCMLVDSGPESPFYECSWTHADASRSEKACRDLEERLLAMEDWTKTPDSGTTTLWGSSYDARDGTPVRLTIRNDETNTVRLHVVPRRDQPTSVESVAPQPSPIQNQSAIGKNGAPAGRQLKMGMMAVASDRDGVIFVDGQRKEVISAGKVITMKLSAGQHFVDLRDSKGVKMWEKIVTVPVGEQVFERIIIGHANMQ